MKKTSQIVTDALTEIVGNPAHDAARIALYFDLNYQQKVDGKHLDYKGFIKHMALLKAHTKRMDVTFLSIVAEGDTVFTHHHVKVEKHQCEKSQFEVMARFTLSSDKIVRCEELTQMISGNLEDRDLGSRS